METTNERGGFHYASSLFLFWAAVVLYVGGLIAPLATISKYFTLEMALETMKEHKEVIVGKVPEELFVTMIDFADEALNALEVDPVLVDEKNTYSVLSGAWELFESNEIFLATVIVLFSVAFPCAKLVSLFILCQGGAACSRELHFKAHAFLGKWSMLDVFVIALLVVSLKLGDMVNVKIHSGIYFFAASVILTMILTQILHKTFSKAK